MSKSYSDLVKFVEDYAKEQRESEDKIEVVRCKDCIFSGMYVGHNMRHCTNTHMYVSDDEYCSRGKKRGV